MFVRDNLESNVGIGYLNLLNRRDTHFVLCVLSFGGLQISRQHLDVQNVLPLLQMRGDG